jgi:predicted ribosomally synthesized peptide with SipW-like signal peptide
MEWEKLSRRKVLAGIASAGGVGAIVGQGTAALFSDEETFTSNAIEVSNNVAGVVDINVEIEADDDDIVYSISLPEAGTTDVGNTKNINNNPSRPTCGFARTDVRTPLRASKPSSCCSIMTPDRASQRRFRAKETQ